MSNNIRTLTLNVHSISAYITKSPQFLNMSRNTDDAYLAYVYEKACDSIFFDVRVSDGYIDSMELDYSILDNLVNMDTPLSDSTVRANVYDASVYISNAILAHMVLHADTFVYVTQYYNNILCVSIDIDK